MKKTDKGCIVISGAGIAGLSAALELAARGWHVKIFDKASVLSEVGAGLQLAPNAMRHLQRLGVAERLAHQSVTPEALYLVNSRNARPLLAMELGQKAEARWGFPYIVCHRADLQAALLGACKDHATIEINLNSEIVKQYTFDEHLRLSVKSHDEICEVDAEYLIGCDGVWSEQRKHSQLAGARFSSYIAWRATMPADALPSSFANALPKQKSVSAWLGKNAHFIAYPVKGGTYFNFVAITAGDNPGQSWSRSGDPKRLQQVFSDWCAPVRSIIGSASDWTFWPLFEMPQTHFVINKRNILLGDASHAVTPFAAQGAALAIEDAAALAESLDQNDLSAALKNFDTVRKKRVSAVAKRGQLNRFAYHASGLFAFGRNMLFASRSLEAFLRDLDWLYDYDAIAALKE